MTGQRWAWGVGLVVLLALFVSYGPKWGNTVAGMVVVGILIYQKQNSKGLFSPA